MVQRIALVPGQRFVCAIRMRFQKYKACFTDHWGLVEHSTLRRNARLVATARMTLRLCRTNDLRVFSDMSQEISGRQRVTVWDAVQPSDKDCATQRRRRASVPALITQHRREVAPWNV